MKKILFSVLCTMVMLCRLQAQNAETHVAVFAGEAPLETLLTEAQKQSVTYLEITGGTLSDKDYAFLRDSLLEQLDTLDLRHAEIDTIPADALGEMNLYLILPEVIECIGDYAFTGECEVTGNFPFLGEFKLAYRAKPDFIISSTNPKLSYVQNKTTALICSKDEDTVFFFRYRNPMLSKEELIIPKGTKIINASAYRGESLYLTNNIVLPESLDSIGDYAFSDIFPEIMTGRSTKGEYQNGGSYNIGSVVCEAKTPPNFGKIGTGNFIGDYCYLYVPEESLEEYKRANGWKRFMEVRSLKNIINSITEIPSRNRIELTVLPEKYILAFPQDVRHIKLYDTKGRMLSDIPIKGKTIAINRMNLLKPFAITHIYFADGTTETVKLIP